MKLTTTTLVIIGLAVIAFVSYKLYVTKLPLARWIGVAFLGEAKDDNSHGVPTLKDQEIPENA